MSTVPGTHQVPAYLIAGAICVGYDNRKLCISVKVSQLTGYYHK